MSDPSLSPVAFWYLRHGETDWNARNLSQGNVDIPLNPTGIAQAREAAVALRGRGIAAILSSPLARARVTAEIVAEAIGLPVTILPELREVAFGVQEGQSMGAWFTAWMEDGFTPEGAESFAALRARAVVAVNTATGHPPPVLVVAHGALFRALRTAMGLEAQARTRNGVPFFCAPPNDPGAAWTLTPAEPGAALTM